MTPVLHIGIDASNIRGGGGTTHLVELLKAAIPDEHGFSRVTVWAGAETSSRISARPWLDLRHDPMLDKSLPYRLFWQRWRLDKELKRLGCDVLFCPGGSGTGAFQPMVTASQNLLPFDDVNRRRYGLSATRLRLELLTRRQTASFHAAAGVVFLTNTARTIVERHTGPLSGKVAVIHHGIPEEAFRAPRQVARAPSWSADRPFRLLYVSIVDVYKNQSEVVWALDKLRDLQFPVHLTLVGSAYGPSLRRLNRAIAQVDPNGQLVTYEGEVPYSDIWRSYRDADAFVFASTCESLPIILLEAMAASLPIACSNRGVMPEVLGDAGVYFDPDDPGEIAAAIRTLVADPARRTALGARAYERARQYSWARCARETFGFLAEVHRLNRATP